MTRTWAAALAVLAFAAAFLAASAALGGEAESDGSAWTANVRLSSPQGTAAGGRDACGRNRVAGGSTNAYRDARACRTRAGRAAPGACTRASSDARTRPGTGTRTRDL